MSNNTGGPAFPKQAIRLTNGTLEGNNEGMTLRDYFAAKAMQGLIASPRGTPNGADATDTYYAEMAYIMADAMLAERER